MINKVFVLSDVHLEKKSKIAQNFMLERINLLISQQQEQGIIPTLVLAGDIHNGVQGFNWMEKINAKIVYICGNHEFWENDYEEVLNQLQSKTPKNVSFLHNDFVEIDNHIFVGGSMWTDIGLSYNPDLFNHASHIMNDATRITYKSWYDNPVHVAQLKKLYSSHSFEQAIEEKHWNILIESQENAKTTDFLNRFGVVVSLLKNIQEEKEHLSRQLVDSYKPITESQYQSKLDILLSYKTKGLGQWLQECENNYIITGSYINKTVGDYSLDSLESIFNKLKLMDFNHKIISVSHHLPFIEERLIGKQDWSRNKDIKLINNINESIYNVRSGINYPMHNYFHEISKGRVDREDSILQVIHYCNNGVSNLSPQFLKHISAWLHGHDHHYNYQDILKNIPIVTNPMGYSMDVFSFKNDQLGLNSNYKNYHNVTDEQKEIEDITSSFMREVKINYTTQQEKENIVKLWALKTFDMDHYLETHTNVLKFNKRLLNYLIKKPHLILNKITANEKEDLTIILSAINYQLTSIDSQQTLLEKGVALRLDSDYSFMNHQNNTYNSFRIGTILDEAPYLNDVLSKVHKLNIEAVEQLNNSEHNGIFNSYEKLVEDSFYNIYVLEKKIKRFIKMKESLNKIEKNYIYNVDPITAKDFFDSLIVKQIDFIEERQIMDTLNDKKKSLVNKHMTPEVQAVLDQRYQKRLKDFDF